VRERGREGEREGRQTVPYAAAPAGNILE